MGPARYLLAFLLLAAGCASLDRSLYDLGREARWRAADLEPRTVTVDDRPVTYLERSGDGPTVVLVHGFGGSSDHWLSFVAALPDGYRVIVPDLAGHGGSEATPSVAYDAPRLAHELEAALRVIAPGRFHLAGSSLGGEVAALVALQRPDRVRSLALYDPAGVASPIPSRVDSLAAAGDLVLIPTSRAGFDRLYELSFVDPPSLPGPARNVLAADIAGRASFLRDLFAALGTERDLLRDRLAEIEPPTLLVWGADDYIIHPSAVSIWAEGLPRVEVRVVPGVGHAPMLERPRETAEAYADFLRRVESGG